MIEVIPKEDDDNEFIKIVEQILMVGVRLSQPEEVFIIKTDHWFDFKWREFSHKIFGALGIWRNPLRIPPFIPDRIIEQKYFQNNGIEYQELDSNPIHIYQPNENNSQRKIKRKSSHFIWFSGQTTANSQASIMVYIFSQEYQNSWYISFTKKSSWQIYKTDNISKAEIKSMLENDYLALIR